jgi:hypothetical protein
VIVRTGIVKSGVADGSAAAYYCQRGLRPEALDAVRGRERTASSETLPVILTFMSTSPDAEHSNGMPPSSDRPLPSFTPVRDASRNSDRVESSTSGSGRKSWMSQNSGENEEPGAGADGRPSASGTAYPDIDGHDASLSSSKTRLRHSSGFLLDSAHHASRLPNAILSRSHMPTRDRKGKRKSDGSDLIIPKRRLAGRGDQERSSIGGSPLASEIKQEVVMDQELQYSQGTASAHSQRSGNRSSKDANRSEFQESPKPTMPRRVPPSVGFDTDPAQIVNMALTLSEGRRRQISGMRVVSGNTPDRRRVSIGQPLHLRSVGYGGGSGQYFNDQRRTSQNFAPGPISASSAEKRFVSSVDPTDFGNGTSQEWQRPDDEQDPTDFYVSPATYARVEKTKAHFELIYNFRRLLSHLPPLRVPTGNHNSPVHEKEGRVYNPLQYVRNRKLRFRERRPLESEDEGWHDIAQVRAWVDAVVASHNEKRVDVDECIRLPEFSQHKLPGVDEEIDPLTTESPASSIRRTSTNPVTKPRRPRSDWVTYPGDLLADAFWLEQGLNKTKIEDREGNKIYPPETHFKFSGWRFRTPVHMPLLQESTPPPADGLDHRPATPPSAVPALPSFTSTAHGRKRSGRAKIRDSIINMPKSGSSSRDRRRRLEQELEITSSSENSDDEVSRRGRKRKPSRRKPREKKTKVDDGVDKRPQNKVDSEDRQVGSPSGGSSGTHSKQPSIDVGSRLSKLISRTSSKPPSLKQDSHRRSDSIRRSFEQTGPPRSSFEETPVRTSAEYDTTAPNSPIPIGFPGIAINLSPPTSRSPSPTKKPFQARINVFRDRSNGKKRNGIETNDFADTYSKPWTNPGGGADQAEIVSEPNSRSTSPMTRRMSPRTKRDSAVSNDSHTHREPHRSSTISRISTKSSGSHSDHHSKIRGIFKGGRIAELVGNEVTRVGDFIWKRDAPGHVPRSSTSTASLNSPHESDSEEDLPKANGHPLSTPAKAHAGQFSSSADHSPEDGRTSPSPSRSTPSSGEKPRYHNPNLPSFTSPFQRDRELQGQYDKSPTTLFTPTSSPPQPDEADHISRIAASHRSASRSPRMDRLAPPKLVTTAPSPRRPGPDERDSYGFGRALDLTRSTNASQVFNDAIKGQPEGVPVTGLAKEWSISDRNLPRPAGDGNVVARRDIARTRALLLSSGVKAREINRRANAVADRPRKFLLDTLEPSNPAYQNPALLRVPRKEEHVVAARNLISSLTSQSASFKEILGRFGTKTTPALHRDLQALDDLVDNQLTPRVRIAADQAGELSMKLSTTSTLAVKALNDSIDGAMRRRRRGPVRYLRRFGYTLIEWTVVGLLWAIWLVVTVVRACLGTARGVFNGIRWLFFL